MQGEIDQIDIAATSHLHLTNTHCSFTTDALPARRLRLVCVQSFEPSGYFLVAVRHLTTTTSFQAIGPLNAVRYLPLHSWPVLLAEGRYRSRRSTRTTDSATASASPHFCLIDLQTPTVTLIFYVPIDHDHLSEHIAFSKATTSACSRTLDHTCDAVKACDPSVLAAPPHTVLQCSNHSQQQWPITFLCQWLHPSHTSLSGMCQFASAMGMLLPVSVPYKPIQHAGRYMRRVLYESNG